jgi:HK97 family phage portal protein
MATSYPLGLRRQAALEVRQISSVPGIERPNFDWAAIGNLANVELPPVTIDSALTVPAVLAAVSFLPRSLAALPLHAYRAGNAGSEKIRGGIETLVHEAPNGEWTAFKLRQYFWQQVFTGGRGLIYIERSGSNVVGLYPMNPRKTTIKRDGMGRTTYEVDGKTYPAADVIDVPFMLKSDGLGHYGPIQLGAAAIQAALAMQKYGAQFFAGGGIPPLALTGPLPTGPQAQKRALEDMHRAVDAAQASNKPMFPVPPGYELKPVGFDPDKGQMTDARRFAVEEIARIFGLPPMFLQDLSKGNFANTEQQDLHLVKHTLSQWCEALEEEMNLKLFGQRNGRRFVEHNVDGLLRGDFKTRMDGLSTAVNSGILTPDEARELENRPAKGGAADGLFMQGATMPIESLAENGNAPV